MEFLTRNVDFGKEREKRDKVRVRELKLIQVCPFYHKLSVILSRWSQLFMNVSKYEHAFRYFHRGIRATGLTAGNNPGSNTNWSVVDGARLPLP